MTLRDQLIRDEGFRHRLYWDSEGHPTIGYGRALDVRGVTEEEAQFLLDNDIRTFTNAVHQALPWTVMLDEPRQAVVINMAFNMGIAGLLGFRNALKAIQEGRYQDAALHLLDSKWAGQVGPRAVRLARQMETGTWQ